MDVAHCYLDGNADAVEFCPHDSYHNVVAASTYTLQENDRPSRDGSISLFKVDVGMGRLDLLQCVHTSGIFDMRWNPVGTEQKTPLLAQADADGHLKIHSLEKCENGAEGCYLREVNSLKVSDSMCLYVDWNSSGTSITVGLSDGFVSIVSLSESKLQLQEAWKAHDYELWTTAFDVHQPNLVYTGADDCKFSCWDLRDSPPNHVFQNAKVHKMGVCSIAKNPCDPNSLITGSYDEHLRVWDVRSTSRPVTVTSSCLGGGVWRVKYHPYVPSLVLAACMHNGFAIVSIQGEVIQVVETYKKHDSLAYGADWHRGEADNRICPIKTPVATCSFYDRLLRVWIPVSDVIVKH